MEFMPRLIMVMFSMLLLSCLGLVLLVFGTMLMRGDTVAIFLVVFSAITLMVAGIWHWIDRRKNV